MRSNQAPYRELYEQLLAYQGSNLFGDLVQPWLRRQTDQQRWLKWFADRSGDPIPTIDLEDDWRLYALSRISDLLLLSFAPPNLVREDSWRLAKITLEEYVEVMTFLGFHRIERARFHPFFHEIVEVTQSPKPETPVSLEKEFWPSFMLGEMLFSRSGCHVAGGTQHLVKEVAEHSTLYWAYARNTRRPVDLSFGWGVNSQWRTDFRRDYLIGGILYYHVDAWDYHTKPYSKSTPLSHAEQLEFLRNRCFVRRSEPDDYAYPYELTFQEPLEPDATS